VSPQEHSLTVFWAQPHVAFSHRHPVFSFFCIDFSPDGDALIGVLSKDAVGGAALR
jgi:WD40 repeat protein